MSVSGIVRSFIWAETTAIRIDTNAEYFSGSTDMRNVEITQASSHVLLYIADSILIAFAGLLIFLFAYNGGFAVYEYFKVKEKKNEEG
jgi:hypothetical protein